MAVHQPALAGETARCSHHGSAGEAIDLAASRARHPSSIGFDESLDPNSRSGVPPVPDVAAAVGHLLALAKVLLLAPLGEGPRRPAATASASRGARLERVARLRDELHVTANRIARLDADDDRIIEDLHVAAPASAAGPLVPEHLLVRLELTAARLVALASALSEDDWMRTAEGGDRLVPFGEVVAEVLDAALQDLHDLVDAGPEQPQTRVGVLGEARRRRDGPAQG